MTTAESINHTINAFNISADSENKIHDDSVAKRFGFQGGLVPGVEVYAYMTNPIIQYFGDSWLENGNAECKFMKPVYDGEQTQVKAVKNANSELLIEVTTPTNFCAQGKAGMAKVREISYRANCIPVPSPDFESRPDASPDSLQKGKLLGTFQQVMTEEDQNKYLGDIRENLSIYKDEKIVHPGWILRMANKALSSNVKLGPWIHVGSKIQNFGAAHYDEILFTQTAITNSYENKGHLFVEMDVKILNDAKCLTQISHTAIYRPRQVIPAN